MIVKKSLAMYIVLSIVTCGLFAIYWVYCIAKDIHILSSEPEMQMHDLPTTPEITTLLFFITCGIYGIFAVYKWGKAMEPIMKSRGLPGEDRSVIYIILALVGFQIVNLAFIQNDLNQIG